MLTISGNPPAVSQFAMENGPLMDDLPIEKYERIHCYVKIPECNRREQNPQGQLG